MGAALTPAAPARSVAPRHQIDREVEMALALTRRPGEQLVLELPDGTRIVVEVADVRGRQVRLAVTAPPEVAGPARKPQVGSSIHQRTTGLLPRPGAGALGRPAIPDVGVTPRPRPGRERSRNDGERRQVASTCLGRSECNFARRRRSPHQRTALPNVPCGTRGGARACAPSPKMRRPATKSQEQERNGRRTSSSAGHSCWGIGSATDRSSGRARDRPT